MIHIIAANKYIHDHSEFDNNRALLINIRPSVNVIEHPEMAWISTIHETFLKIIR